MSNNTEKEAVKEGMKPAKKRKSYNKRNPKKVKDENQDN
jgi:hypothetical protein